MRRARSAFAALFTLSFAPVAHAESAPWLSLSGPCPASAEDVARRVEGALVGARPEASSARIDIADSAAGLKVRIGLRRGEAELGVKTLTVPSCDEALDAAVLIVAVAIGEASAPRAAGEAKAKVAARAPSRPAPRAAPVTDDRDWAATVAATSSSPSASTWLLGGADVGTLPQPTPYVGAAVALLRLPVELRAAFRYGVQREETTEDSGASERTSTGFAALELSGCRGTGSQLRWTLCAGGEFGVVQIERAQGTGADRVDVDESAPRLAGLLAGRAGTELGGVQAELELAGFATAVGPGGAARAGGRAGIAAGLRF